MNPLLPYWLIVAHLIGDYALQSHVMATRKTSSMYWAAVHALFYSLPFAALLSQLDLAPERAGYALAIIGGTHAVIDRYALARRWCQLYGVGHSGVWWSLVRGWWLLWDQGERGEDDLSPEPEFAMPPPFIGTWLVIVVDNAAHLAINGLAIAWALA